VRKGKKKCSAIGRLFRSAGLWAKGLRMGLASFSLVLSFSGEKESTDSVIEP
jgi:hypothetical protein